MLSRSGTQQGTPAQGHSADEQRAGVSRGDFRGRYGYGRPAHRADPNASYRIELPPPFSMKR